MGFGVEGWARLQNTVGKYKEAARDGRDDLLAMLSGRSQPRCKGFENGIATHSNDCQQVEDPSYGGTPARAPHINEETAMLLVNQYLAAQGSAATCGRDDVRAAIEYLANLTRAIGGTRLRRPRHRRHRQLRDRWSGSVPKLDSESFLWKGCRPVRVEENAPWRAPR